MKNALLILNIILLILVGYLYYAQFSKKSVAVPQKEKSESADSAQQKVNIAYIDLDSLQSHYGYYKKIKADFEKKQTAATNELSNMQKRFQTRAMALQEKAQGMSPQEQENAMQEMNKMQTDLQRRNMEVEKEIVEYNAKMTEDIVGRIQSFLKEYNKDGRYSYIFSYEPGFMFYKDSALDITTDVIKGLNDLYSKENK